MPGRRDTGVAPDPRRLAGDAARRLVDGRAADPDSALRQAAKACGVRDRARLPPVAMVVEAACAERRLFGGEAHGRHLAALRRSAIEAMRFLAAFEPRLVGGVLDGWAGEGAVIQLQLYTDDAEGLLLRLGEIGVRPRVILREALTAEDASPRERLAFVAGGIPIELAVFKAADLRRRTVASGLGRATLAEVEALCSSAP